MRMRGINRFIIARTMFPCKNIHKEARVSQDGLGIQKSNQPPCTNQYVIWGLSERQHSILVCAHWKWPISCLHNSQLKPRLRKQSKEKKSIRANNDTVKLKNEDI